MTTVVLLLFLVITNVLEGRTSRLILTLEPPPAVTMIDYCLQCLGCSTNPICPVPIPDYCGSLDCDHCFIPIQQVPCDYADEPPFQEGHKCEDDGECIGDLCCSKYDQKCANMVLTPNGLTCP
eukprot:368193_1